MVDNNISKETQEFFEEYGGMKSDLKNLGRSVDKLTDKIEHFEQSNRKSRGDLYEKLRKSDVKNSEEHSSILTKISNMKLDNVKVSTRVATIYAVGIATVIALIGYFIDKV